MGLLQRHTRLKPEPDADADVRASEFPAEWMATASRAWSAGIIPEGVRQVLAAPAPCDDCPLRQRCATKHLACRAFLHYVKSTDGTWDASQRVKPTWAKYDAAYRYTPSRFAA